MMRKDVNKPKGKTSAYAFFVQTCREEHRKKNPEQSVNFAEFSKKCSERWKVSSQSQKTYLGQVGRPQRHVDGVVLKVRLRLGCTNTCSTFSLPAISPAFGAKEGGFRIIPKF